MPACGDRGADQPHTGQSRITEMLKIIHHYPAAHGPPHQKWGFQIKGLDDRLDVFRPRAAPVIAGLLQRFVRLPMAAQIWQDQPKLTRQSRLPLKRQVAL